MKLSAQHLDANGLKASGAATLDEINFDMPPLRGDTIRDHFTAISQGEAQPWLDMAFNFVTAALPEVPECWATEWPGWTKYNADGSIEPVSDLGDENIVSYDIETLYKLSPYPVMATAVTPNAWYSWLSPTIFEDPPEVLPGPRPKWDKRVPECHPHELIPMFNNKTNARLVIGHNVSYDRQSIEDEYTLDETRTRFLDTLSLHVATRGITSVQRAAWHKHRKAKHEYREEESGIRHAVIEILEEINPEIAERLKAITEDSESLDPPPESSSEGREKWEDITSINSLADVASLHCGIKVDKTIRDRFGDDSITHASQIRSELSELLQYCAEDSKTTQQVFSKVFPQFIESCPHPASFAGALAMGSAILPVDEGWMNYIKTAEETYNELDKGVTDILRSLAEKLRLEGPKQDDPWISQMDWRPKAARWPDSGPDAPPEAVEAVEAARALLNRQHTAAEGDATTSDGASAQVEETPTPVPDDPTWVVPFTKDPVKITAKLENTILPLLLQLSYQGFPIIYTDVDGWCFRVPRDTSADKTEEIVSVHGQPVELGPRDAHLADWNDDHVFYRLAAEGKTRKVKLLSKTSKPLVAAGLASAYGDVFAKTLAGPVTDIIPDLPLLIDEMKKAGPESPWGRQLDWTSLSKREYSSALCNGLADKQQRQHHADHLPPKPHMELGRHGIMS